MYTLWESKIPGISHWIVFLFLDNINIISSFELNNILIKFHLIKFNL